MNRGLVLSEEEFQAIKNERILERRRSTKAVRRNGHDVIRDRKSKIGLDPLEYFPKEIWNKILDPDNVSARDLGSIYVVHNQFQDVLDIRRVRDILLPQILMLKFAPERKLDTNSRHNVYDIDDEFYDDIPNKTTSLQLPEFIRLRQLSKSTRNAIDKWFEGELLTNLRSEVNIKIPSLSFRFVGDKNPGNPWQRKLDGILKNFGENNQAKRVFFRSIKIAFKNGVWEEGGFLETFMEFKRKIKNLLELIGDQIWRLEFNIAQMGCLERFGGVPVVEVQNCLKDFMENLPNLKWLVLKNREIGECSLSRVSVSENIEFPCLSRLERICFDFDSRNYTNVFCMFSQVLRANTNVKMLNIVPGVYLYGNHVFFQKHLNPLLESLPELSLELFSINPSWAEKFVFEIIQHTILCKSKWPLKRMYLVFNCPTTVPLKFLFQSLENFQSLEHLTLQLVDVQFYEDEEIHFLRLPKLAHLEMEMRFSSKHVHGTKMDFSPAANFVCSLQFLLFAKALKKLFWKLILNEAGLFGKLRRFLVYNECHEKQINFRGGMRDLRTSNMWDFFPALETVEVKIERACGDVERKSNRGQKM